MHKKDHILVNTLLLKSLLERVDFSVTANQDYVQIKNLNKWDDPISQCLTDDLYIAFESLQNLLLESIDKYEDQLEMSLETK